MREGGYLLGAPLLLRGPPENPPHEEDKGGPVRWSAKEAKEADMTDQDRDRDGVKIERDHPQTRKGEEDARGSAEWNEDVIDPEDLEEGEARRKHD